MSSSSGPLKELVFFQEPYWASDQSDVVKSLLLFFDGVALLTPDYMYGRAFASDPALAEPLADQGLLHILSPEELVDEQVAASLADLWISSRGCWQVASFKILIRVCRSRSYRGADLG